MPGSAFAQLPEAAGVAAIDLGGAWQFKATDEAAWAPAEVPDGAQPGQGRWRIYGLHLPDEVLRQVYFENAARLLRIEV